MRESKIAILVPTYNSGALLAETVASAAKAGLPPNAYEFIVTDNASDDGSTDRLANRDPQGAAVTLYRNTENIGRVENWNRALAIARHMGFGHALFLMAGDLLRDASVIALHTRMLHAGASLGLASYEIVDEQLGALRIARRLHWRADGAVAAERFLSQTLSIGGMLFGPLGANLYNLAAAPLTFDPADPTHTDQAATIAFLRAAQTPVVYLDRPITQWRAREARFHSSMNLARRLADDLALIERVCREMDIEADSRKIRCTLFLRSIFNARGNPARALPDLQRLLRNPAQIEWFWMVRLLFRQLAFQTPWRIAR